MKPLLIGLGIGLGFFGACLIVGSRLFDNLQIDFGEDLLPPECDEQHVEDDGDITLYCSGPIRPIHN